MSSSLLGSPLKHGSVDVKNPHRRVILLLDMDCFYAQCETVRLGLDPSLPLALVQWNSALAVNYPARAFGIKRGDSYEAIREKSKGECTAIHLPVSPVEEERAGPKASPPQRPQASAPRAERTGGDHDVMLQRCGEQSSSLSLSDRADVDLSWTAYDKEFNQPANVREEMYRQEKNKMRSPSEGKACLDRYRLASSRIFSLIDATLAENLGRKSFMLERASIDELFVDVTAFCYRPMTPDAGDDDKERESTETRQFRSDCEINAMRSLKESIVCHEESLDLAETNDEALRLGCHVALVVRRAVFRTLGFTLSAGISTSKLVSKLAASYGKPNGQAVIFPGAISNVMNETQLRKARRLGGKLGKKVQSLLPDSETTLGSISRLLPLSCLVESLGEESGRWVFDACRGVDYEEVKTTLKVLPKSITAFKSFQQINYPEAEKWTKLLARDIMKRVEVDSAQNHRIPKSVTVGYTIVPGGAWIGRSFRLPFPTGDFHSRVQKLVDNTRNALMEKGHTSFIRLGFSAVDFVVRPKVGIDSFFSKRNIRSSPKSHLVSGKSYVKKEAHAEPVGIDSFFSTSKPQPATQRSESNSFLKPFNDGRGALHETNELNQRKTSLGLASELETKEKDLHSRLRNDPTTMTDEEIARQLQESYDAKATEGKQSDRDKALACQLQSSFDREHSILSHVERFSAKRSSNSKMKSHTKANNNKRSKIDYFLKSDSK